MSKDNVEMIFSVGELARLFETSDSLESFLQRAVGIIAYHMKAAVCSIYLWDEATQELTLRATQGLSAGSVGRVRLKLGEGITGLAVKELRTIRAARGARHPHFKLIPGLAEEGYEAFLAVPILHGMTRVGALVVQDPQPHYFTANDAKALGAIAAQLATTIEMARLLISLHSQRGVERGIADTPAWLKGTTITEGLAEGPARVINQAQDWAAEACARAPAGLNLADFERALRVAEEQLQQLQQELETRLSDMASLIFNAQLLMLKDSHFAGAMVDEIRAGAGPVEAIVGVVNRYSDLFAASANPRLQEKVQDVRDVGVRLLNNLRVPTGPAENRRGHVIIARDLLPSDIVKMAAEGAAGFIALGGGTWTSHVAILARSMELPAVLLAEPSLLDLPAETPILMDATQGHVFVRPGREVLERYRALREDLRRYAAPGAEVAPETYTRDGTRVRLLANINLLSDLTLARRFRAEGIGLYRSEFPFIIRNNFPSEEEQFAIYRKLLDAAGNQPVTFRTLDVGGDKMLSYFPHLNEANPFLGLRALRFSLKHREIFDRQIRALLRAGADRDLRIMFPLVSSLDDFLAARQIVDECSAALRREGIPHHERPQLGLMVELPSAVELADELAQAADFLSIGTNDLVQYMLAVDRTNDAMAHLYQYYHPAVLRAVARVARAAQERKREISLCGDMAAEQRMTPFLLGIGLRCFSVDPHAIPALQRCIQTVHLDEARRQAQELLSLGTLREVAERLDWPSAPVDTAPASAD